MQTWSHYQEAVFDFVAAHPDRNLVVEALAGSGKTSTIVELLHRLPAGGLLPKGCSRQGVLSNQSHATEGRFNSRPSVAAGGQRCCSCTSAASAGPLANPKDDRLFAGRARTLPPQWPAPFGLST